MGAATLRALSALAMIAVFALGLPPYCWGQLGQGANGPAASWASRTFTFENKWAMYGAPQATKLNEDQFNLLVTQVRQTNFATNRVQIVVIVKGADASGTIGLIEKKGKLVNSIFLRSGGLDVYDIWHKIGHRTSPEKISADFRSNVLAAEEAYKDLPIFFVGTVHAIAKDELGEIYVEFFIKGGEASLQCYPWQGAPQGVDLRKIKSGQKIKVSGQFSKQVERGPLKVRGCLFSR